MVGQKNSERTEDNSLISVVVPVFNVEKYLSRCIDSIINQTYRNLEIILVDDGSSDKCPQICDSYALKDKRIKVMHKKNEGVSEARNVGLHASKGKYISFIDSDDYINEFMFEKMVKAYTNNQIDLVVCAFNREYNEHKDKYSYGKDFILQKNKERDVFDLFKEESIDMNCVWNKLYKKENIVKDFDKEFKYGEDQLFNLNYCTGVQSLSYICEPLYNYIIHDTSFIVSHKFDNFDLHKKLFNEQKRFCFENKNNKLLSFFCSVMIKYFIINLYYKKKILGYKATKEHFKQSIKEELMVYALKNCHEKSFKVFVCKFTMKFKLFFLALHIANLNENKKQKRVSKDE